MPTTRDISGASWQEAYTAVHHHWSNEEALADNETRRRICHMKVKVLNELHWRARLIEQANKQKEATAS